MITRDLTPNARVAAYVEEGSAFMELAGSGLAARAGRDTADETRPLLPAVRAPETERFKVIVIGAGQSGLATGYYLKQAGLPFVILEANQRVGDSWRQRWDSLRLFTPAGYSSIVGMPFPAHPHAFPTKDAMADYLEAYAARFDLPVRTGIRVDRLTREGGRYVVTAGDRRFEADHVVVAMASYQRPVVPPFAKELDPTIVQFHSIDYRNPGQFKAGGVLIAGGGNSGSEIALEAVRGHETWMSGRDTGHIPFRVEGVVGRYLLIHLVFFVFRRVLTLDTPLGRKVHPKVVSQGGPLIRVKPKDLAAAGVKRVPKVVGVRDGMPVLEDGRVLDVANVVWCTGFHPGFSWIDLPVFDGHGEPKHSRGRVEEEPGLYFVGLHFLYAFSSTMIQGVSRDARHVVGQIAARATA